MPGSRRQISYEIKSALIEKVRTNPNQSTKDLQNYFYDQYKWEICQTTLSCILKKEGLGIKKSGGKGRNRLSEGSSEGYNAAENADQSYTTSSGISNSNNNNSNTIRNPMDLSIINNSPYSDPATESTLKRKPKTGLAIKDILCDSEDDTTISNNTLSTASSSTPNTSTASTYSTYNNHNNNNSFTTANKNGSDKSPSPSNNAVNSPSPKSTIKADIYDVSIINPMVKRFRPSSQYQQLEKLVLKLACDVFKKYEDQNLNNNGNNGTSSSSSNNNNINTATGGRVFNDPSKPMGSSSSSLITFQLETQKSRNNSINTDNASYPISKSEMVKLIKREIQDKYKHVEKPIYLNQFIHKCLKRYKFTNELIKRLEG